MKKIRILNDKWIEKLALVNGIFSGVTLYPQLFILLTSPAENVQNISTLSFILIISNSLIWLWYGIYRRNYPLIISSSLNAVASGAILVILF